MRQEYSVDFKVEVFLASRYPWMKNNIWITPNRDNTHFYIRFHLDWGFDSSLGSVFT